MALIASGPYHCTIPALAFGEQILDPEAFSCISVVLGNSHLQAGGGVHLRSCLARSTDAAPMQTRDHPRLW
eukprot:350874-Chlamydomonas_euryale.AAC.11